MANLKDNENVLDWSSVEPISVKEILKNVRRLADKPREHYKEVIFTMPRWAAEIYFRDSEIKDNGT